MIYANLYCFIFTLLLYIKTIKQIMKFITNLTFGAKLTINKSCMPVSIGNFVLQVQK